MGCVSSKAVQKDNIEAIEKIKDHTIKNFLDSKGFPITENQNIQTSKKSKKTIQID